MKKTLFIMHYPPPVHGASMVGQYIKDSQQTNNAFDCRYINLGTSTKVDEIGLGGLAKLFRYFKIMFKVLGQLIRFRPNLVYFTLTATGAGFFKDASIVMWAKLFGKKVVHHMHNKGVSLRQHKWFYDVCYRLVFHRADVILLSPHLYGDVKKYVSPDKVHYCPNGVPDESQVIPRAEKKENGIHLLFLSNLIESKGLLDLLKACQIMKTNGTQFRCTIIGGEADISTERLERTIKDLGLQQHIKYAGKRYGKEKVAAYTAADIFVFPTYYPNECFPLVLLEAMQYALPIISTYEGGIRDIVVDGGTGFLVAARKVGELAEHIEKLAEDESLRIDFGTKGRQRYEEKFTLSTFESNFTYTLKKIAG